MGDSLLRPALESLAMKFAEICVRHPVFTVMLIAFLLTLGHLFLSRTGGRFVSEGRSRNCSTSKCNCPEPLPKKWSRESCLPLEDAISSVSGIDEMSVYASEGLADITCTFVLERDIDGAAQDIREKVSAAAINRLPRETLPPVITKEDPQSDPIMTLLVSGSMSRRELTEIADKQVRRAIQTVDGVGSVELNGGQARQIRVLLDAQKLTSHNFTVLDVRNALQRENIEAPGGRIITGPQELGLRTLGRVYFRRPVQPDRRLGTRGGMPGPHSRRRASRRRSAGAAHMVRTVPAGKSWEGCSRYSDPAAVRREHCPSCG